MNSGPGFAYKVDAVVRVCLWSRSLVERQGGRMVTKIAKQREDEYFARTEFDRCKKLAEERAAKLKQKELDELKRLHWMRCPKDGLELIEIELRGVRVDKCSHCGGIYLDNGELEKIVETRSGAEGFVSHILKVFR